MKSPYYPLVPKDAAGNIAYRLELLALGDESDDHASAIREMCRDDFLFFLNSFAFLIEPRNFDPNKRILPFITRQYQDEDFAQLDTAFGVKDVVWEKSREMGVSWMVLWYFVHKFLFTDWCVLGLVSKNQDAVDKNSDPDSLMPKIEAAIKLLPAWLLPHGSWENGIDRASLKIVNLENNSSIMGYPATGDVSRGGRKLALLMDEFHSFNEGEDYDALKAAQHATRCRVFVSTPKKPSGAFYDVVHDEKPNVLRLKTHWSRDRAKAAGAYQAIDGKLKVLDGDYKFEPDYPFILDGKLRSPYYDWECGRPGATPQSIAQELDINYGGAGAPYFDMAKLEACQRIHCRPAWQVGSLLFDSTFETYDPTWQKHDDGHLKVWCVLDHYGQPPKSSYVVGVDVAAGTAGSHSSNSTMFVIDANTGEQAAEFAANDVNPIDFAGLTVAVCHWFHGAKLIWEANGSTGSQFGGEIGRIGYGNIHYRKPPEMRYAKQTKKPGFWSDDKTKPHALSQLQRAMVAGELIVHSIAVYQEMKQYIWSNGRVEHSAALTSDDPAGQGKAHGDRVIAAAVCWHGKGETLKPVNALSEAYLAQNPPIGSMAYRLREYDRERAMADYDSEPEWH